MESVKRIALKCTQCCAWRVWRPEIMNSSSQESQIHYLELKWDSRKKKSIKSSWSKWLASQSIRLLRCQAPLASFGLFTQRAALYHCCAAVPQKRSIWNAATASTAGEAFLAIKNFKHRLPRVPTAAPAGLAGQAHSASKQQQSCHRQRQR